LLHLILALFTIFATWKWGDWKNWHKYHSSMIYIAMGNLLYAYLYDGHHLWQYNADLLVFNHFIADTLTTFIILPLTALIFLTKYPDTFKGQLFRVVKFITIYFLIEVVYDMLGIFGYNYGWNIWWSLAWLFMMFPMLVLHHKKPLIAYGASSIAVIIMLLLFPVSFN